LSTQELLEQLSHKYSGQEWAFFSEVPNGTGSAMNRSADGLAMSLWPSRGLELIGFEIKKSRQDWNKELKSPEKAESICQFCDRWYVVAPKGLVFDYELPPTWGLLESTGKTLRTKVKAPKLNPNVIDRAFLAAILRKASDQPADLEKKAYEQGLHTGVNRGKAWNEGDLRRAELRLKELKTKLDNFEKASGIKIDSWNCAEKMGEAVKLVMNNKKDIENALVHTINRFNGLLKELNNVKKELV